MWDLGAPIGQHGETTLDRMVELQNVCWKLNDLNRVLIRHKSMHGQFLTCGVGHVNNVMYNRYAESARVNWTRTFGELEPAHKNEWRELMTPKSIGLILRSIRTDYKFVRTSR